MSKKPKIYTRSGDHGMTSLFTGERVAKSDKNITALGDIDECNSALGLALAWLPKEYPFDLIREQLDQVQRALFELGAAVATPRTRAPEAKLSRTRFGHEATSQLEEWIDQLVEGLPPLTHFILPSGHPAAAALHLARSICRRAERSSQLLVEEVSQEVLVYLNRLSDYLFTLARQVNQLAGTQELIWVASTSDL